jgi:alkyl hydroperoxide reductase subunit AhpC
MDCALCEAVSGQMKPIYDEFKDKGVEVMAIYTGSSKKRKEWTRYIAEKGFEWTNLYDKKDTQEMFAKYNLAGVPAIYLLDEEKNTIAKDITPKMLNEILNYLLYD